MLACTTRSLRWAKLVREGRHPSLEPDVEPGEEPADTAEEGQFELYRQLSATEVITREVMRIVISLVVLALGHYLVIAGGPDAQQ